MRRFFLFLTLVLALLVLPATSPPEVRGEQGGCQTPCRITNIYTNEQGQLCITTFCPCTQQTTTECRDPE